MLGSIINDLPKHIVMFLFESIKITPALAAAARDKTLDEAQRPTAVIVQGRPGYLFTNDKFVGSSDAQELLAVTDTEASGWGAFPLTATPAPATGPTPILPQGFPVNQPCTRPEKDLALPQRLNPCVSLEQIPAEILRRGSRGTIREVRGNSDKILRVETRFSMVIL